MSRPDAPDTLWTEGPPMSTLSRRTLLGAAAVAAAAPGFRVAAQTPAQITIAQQADATTLDPAKHSFFPTANVLFQIFDCLVSVDAAGTFQPALALAWSNPDPLTWRFKLRVGVTFHNGEPFNAKAVKFTFERALDPAFKAPYFSRISAIKAVEVIDDETVDFKTAQPFPTMLSSLYEASFASMIVPPGYLAEKGANILATQPVGTGPYRFVEWRKDDRLVLEANPAYWGGAPKIARVVFRPIKETRTRIAELRSNGVDLAVDIPPEDVPAIDRGETKIISIASDALYFFGFDTLKASPLQDKRVRQALNHALDVAAIQKALLSGMGTPIALTLPVTAFGYDPAWRPYAYDPAKAKALLAEAGYADGFSVQLDSRQGRYLKDREILEACIGYFGKVGVKVTPNFMEAGVWAQVSEKKGRQGLVFGGWSGNDPDLVWYPLLHTGEYQSYYSNPALDTLLEQGRSTLDAAARKAIYEKAAAIIKDDAPHLPMLQPPLIYGASRKLTWTPRTDSLIDLRKAAFA